MNLRRTILGVLCAVLTLPLFAAGTDEPIFSFKTHRYETMGDDNQVAFSLMPRFAVGTAQVDVDFGFGRRTYTIEYDGMVSEDDSLETIVGGTTISGSVSSEGIVRVYGTATDIDYLDVSGTEIYDLDIENLTRLRILSTAHNEIEKLDVSMMPELQYLDLKDNPYNKGLVIGNNHSMLSYLNINKISDTALASGTVDLSPFQQLVIFTAWDSKCLKTLDVSKNPKLVQLSIDNSGVNSLDVTKNTYLQILNVSDCGFNTLDVSKNPYLVELYIDNEGQVSADHKISSLDLSKNPYLQRLFCNGNLLETIDVSKQKNLVSLYASNNYLTEIKGLENVDSLAWLDISVNCFDFASFPEVDPMTYFYYVLQREMKVGTEYKEGTTLDLSHRVLREGTETACALAIVPSSGIEDPIQLVEGVDYLYEDGKITFLKPQEERVAAYFLNSDFPDVMLQTTEFWVRSEEEFGQPVPQISFVPKSNGSERNISFTLGVERSDAFPEEEILVDFGNGVSKSYAVDGNSVNVNGVATGAVTISGRIEMPINSFALNEVALENIDLTKASYLENLELCGDSLNTIDLSWNNLLQSVKLNGNKLDSLVLTGVNDAHHKNVLSIVEARNNNLRYFDDIVGITIESLDLSNNKFSEFDFSSYYGLKYLNLSNNKFKTINLDSCENLVELHIENNDFTLSTLPQLKIANYNYAPQHPMTISSRSMFVTLTSEANVGGAVTSFVWKEANSGAVLVENVDYTVTNSKFVFLEPAVGKDVYCELSNATFPAFAQENTFRSTVVRVMGKPTYTVASLKTPVGGQIGELSFAGKKDNTFIYIDWGNGDMIEYQLQEMFQLYNVESIENGEVKVYSYEAADGNIHVFSVDGISMSDVDVSNMKNLYCLALCGAGLESIDLSQNTGLAELNLENNKLTSIDLSNNTNLFSLMLPKNKLSEIDLSHQDGLGWLVLSDNNLSSFYAPNLSQLYTLSLTRNNLSELDLSPYTGLRQLAVAENNLTSIDLSKHPIMEVVDLSQNKFTLATLPIPSNKYMIYNYGNQAPVEVECINDQIDLSAMAEIAGVASHFYWFEGALNLYYDENDELQMTNYEFVENTDFVVNGGITTFAHAHDAVTGYIQNDLFPNILLFTRTIPVTGSTAIEQVKSETASGMRFNLYGQRVKQAEGLTISNGKKIFK